LALAFALRLLVLHKLDERLAKGVAHTFGDSESYIWLGQTIAQGLDYGIPSRLGCVFRTPGYPLLLAGAIRLKGPFTSEFAFNALDVALGVLAVASVFWLGCCLFDEQTGLLAAAMASVYPGAISSSVFVLSEAPFCPLMVAQLAAQAAAWRAKWRAASFGWSFAAGALAGAATLMRPSWLLFVPFAMICGMVFSRPRLRHLDGGLATLVGLIVVMTPWWIRNYQVVGRFVPTTLQVGASLYDGLNPKATGASDMSGVEDRLMGRLFLLELEKNRLIQAKQPDTEPTLAKIAEYDFDRDLRQEALAWAREHPGRVLRLAAIKFTRMWNVWPNEPQFRSWPVRLAVFFSYVPIMALALWGAWKFRDRGWPCVLCWLPAVYLTLLHMVFVSSIRYREPAMLPLIVLAAGAAVSWWRSKMGIKPTHQVSSEGGTP
jgi:4-amino-4-deoxy-L-arabinose transferase-like glycosyltransferase